MTHQIVPVSHDLCYRVSPFTTTPCSTGINLSPICVHFPCPAWLESTFHPFLCRLGTGGLAPGEFKLRRLRQLAVISFRGHLPCDPQPKVLVFICKCWFRLHQERIYSEEPVQCADQTCTDHLHTLLVNYFKMMFCCYLLNKINTS